jgi:hypothetical protein
MISYLYETIPDALTWDIISLTDVGYTAPQPHRCRLLVVQGDSNVLKNTTRSENTTKMRAPCSQKARKRLRWFV